MTDGAEQNDAPVAERFASALNAGRLELPYCRQCESFVWYPRSHCSTCGSRDLTLSGLTGRGIVHSYTRLHGSGEDSGVVQRVIGYVDLREGPRVLCLLTGSAPPRIDAPVHFDAAASAEGAALCFAVDAD